MAEQKIQEIKDAIRDLIKFLLEKKGPLSNEQKILLARVLEFAANRILQLREEGDISPPDNDVPTGPFPSSNVEGFRFNPKTKELLVQFHGPYPQAKGSVYSYKGVPDYIFDVFSRGAVGPKTSGANRYHKWQRGVTPSLGGSLNALLKAGGFQYQKLR